jgi:hypothetical protein
MALRGNVQLVGTNGSTISVMMPKFEMTKDEAIEHAAWILVLADTSLERFREVWEEVLGS